MSSDSQYWSDFSIRQTLILHRKEIGRSLIFSRIASLDEEKREILVEIERQTASSGGQKKFY